MILMAMLYIYIRVIIGKVIRAIKGYYTVRTQSLTLSPGASALARPLTYSNIIPIPPQREREEPGERERERERERRTREELANIEMFLYMYIC